MHVKRRYLAFSFLVAFGLLSSNSSAQQITLGSQYLINDFSLSPAFAGANDNVEAIMSYRNDGVGIEGSPESRLININGALPNLLGFLPVAPSEIGIGATIYSQEAGMFRTNGFSATFAYKFKVAAVQSVRLGLSVGLIEHNLNLSDLGSNALNDPALMNSTDVRSVMFDATFGALYHFQKLYVGVAVPRLLETAVKSDSTTFYTMSRHYVVHGSYKLGLTPQLSLEPFLVARTTANSVFNFEVAAKTVYQKQWWLALMYRKGGTMGLTLGGKLFSVVQMAYGYEFSGEGMLGRSNGTHEITLGFLIGESKSDAPAATIKKPYYDWVK